MHTENDILTAANNILDVFTGIDGAVQFTKFWHITLPAIFKDIEDPSAQRLCGIIADFNKLISIKYDGM